MKPQTLNDEVEELCFSILNSRYDTLNTKSLIIDLIHSIRLYGAKNALLVDLNKESKDENKI